MLQLSCHRLVGVWTVIVLLLTNAANGGQLSPISLGIQAALGHKLRRQHTKTASTPTANFFDPSWRTSTESYPTYQSALLRYHDQTSVCSTFHAFHRQQRSTGVETDSDQSEYAALTETNPSCRSVADRAVAQARNLLFWENMICGAISRSVAQTVMHPANTMKTLLQNSRGEITVVDLAHPQNWKLLSRGAGANFLLSVPHGAINFAVLELVRSRLERNMEKYQINAQKWGAGLDFLSSCISTVTCSVVSTPQMMICDNIMAGNYPDLGTAITGLWNNRGVMGFYTGWWPGLVGKIPSYAITWTLFQQVKRLRNTLSSRPATDLENSIMGCIASATTVSLMIPVDTIKTRLVTQAGRVSADLAYKGIIDCAVRVFREEGMGALYRGLPPRLVSVVPMIGIQFGVYEFMKKTMQKRTIQNPHQAIYDSNSALQEAMMEVAADPEQPFPAPHFLQRMLKKQQKRRK